MRNAPAASVAEDAGADRVGVQFDPQRSIRSEAGADDDLTAGGDRSRRPSRRARPLGVEHPPSQMLKFATTALWSDGQTASDVKISSRAVVDHAFVPHDRRLRADDRCAVDREACIGRREDVVDAVALVGFRRPGERRCREQRVVDGQGESGVGGGVRMHGAERIDQSAVEEGLRASTGSRRRCGRTDRRWQPSSPAPVAR